MNKQELIAEYERVSNFVETVKTKSVIDKLKQLDEPKVQVPEFVADWIFKAQLVDRRSIRSALETGTIRLYAKNSDEVIDWLKDISNQDTFARAWANDYTVEKEKRYLVEVKGVSGYGRYLNKALSSGEYFFASDNELGLYITKHTRKELEEDGWGWVFDCPGIDIEEVE